MIECFAALLNSGDVDGALALYDDEAVFAVGPDEIVRGREQIRKALDDFAELNPTLTGEVVKVHETAGHAVVFNKWALTGTAPDGGHIEMGGTSADVLRRDDDGRWRVLIDDPWGA